MYDLYCFGARFGLLFNFRFSFNFYLRWSRILTSNTFNYDCIHGNIRIAIDTPCLNHLDTVNDMHALGNLTKNSISPAAWVLASVIKGTIIPYINKKLTKPLLNESKPINRPA